jgi:hypothetical protein
MKPILLAAAVALLAPTPPFPAPRLGGATADTRCDWGPIASTKTDGAELVVRTEAGPLTLRVGPGVKVADADGKPLGSVADLHAGQNVRVYYLVNDGARAQEIDVIAER